MTPSGGGAGLRFGVAVLCILAASACAGQGTGDEAPETPLLPGGYRVQVDPHQSGPGRFDIAETPEGIRITTGPAGIAWRPADTVSAGDFRAEASFTLVGAPAGYREGYGLFAGGRGLEGAGATYLYLLVRGDGSYLVKRRLGDASETLLDWTPHVAVQRVAAHGDSPVNVLAIEAREGEARLMVNGTVVFRMPLEEAGLYGTAGLRVNHRLHLEVGGWTLGPPPPEPAPDP